MEKDNIDSSSDDEMPELEDMSESLKKINLKPKITQKNPKKVKDYTKTTEELDKERQKEQDELDRKLAQAYLKSQKTAQKKDPLRIDEVQENMKKTDLASQIVQSKDQWMTPDLLQKISKSPSLLEGFKDPETMQAIAVLQKNPKLAKEKYGKNPKISKFLMEFSQIMGQHFTNLGENQKKEKAKKKGKKVQKKKPEIRQVASKTREQIELEKKMQDPTVKDKQVQNFIRFLQTSGQPLDFFQLARSNPELAQKIKFLLDKGIFNASYQR